MINSGVGGKVTSHGYKVDYVRWGDEGPSIVIIHSMGLDAHSMDLLTERLSDAAGSSH